MPIPFYFLPCVFSLGTLVLDFFLLLSSEPKCSASAVEDARIQSLSIAPHWALAASRPHPVRTVRSPGPALGWLLPSCSTEGRACFVAFFPSHLLPTSHNQSW